MSRPRTIAGGRPSRALTPEVKEARRVARFWAKVEKTPECWLWVGARVPDGYGHVRQAGVVVPAHRLAYEMEVGPIPEGWEVDHLCYVPACVRPSHLEAVSPAENRRRAASRKSTCKWGHPFEIRPDGSRWCRECHRRHSLEWARNGPKKNRVVGDGRVCGRGHEWTEETMYVSPGGLRYCRTCRNERRRKT